MEYVHGAELDAPLALYRAEYSDSIGGGYYIPLANWKGSYDGGYSIEECYTRDWSIGLAPPVGPQIGSDTTKSNASSGTEDLCPTIEWPAQHEWTARHYRRGYGGPRTWMGSLIYGQRDFSGLHYRRNRFYDSEQGRFTQEDPIGLAGGINLYGFANGDPVSYDDPYGLFGCEKGDIVCESVGYRILRYLGIGDETASNIMLPAALGSRMVPGTGTLVYGYGGSGARAVANQRLNSARAARDALADEAAAGPQNKRPAIVTGGYNTRTGQVTACASGGGRCAEDNVVEALGGNSREVKMTEPVRPRATGHVQKEVCERCEERYGRQSFPQGTRYNSDRRPR